MNLGTALLCKKKKWDLSCNFHTYWGCVSKEICAKKILVLPWWDLKDDSILIVKKLLLHKDGLNSTYKILLKDHGILGNISSISYLSVLQPQKQLTRFEEISPTSSPQCWLSPWNINRSGSIGFLQLKMVETFTDTFHFISLLQYCITTNPPKPWANTSKYSPSLFRFLCLFSQHPGHLGVLGIWFKAIRVSNSFKTKLLYLVLPIHKN